MVIVDKDLFVFLLLRQGGYHCVTQAIVELFRGPVSNSRFTCLLSAESKGVRHHTQLGKTFFHLCLNFSPWLLFFLTLKGMSMA